MKIFKIAYSDELMGNCLEWRETRAEAERFASKMKAIYQSDDACNVEVIECEIKPTRRGIVEWLARQGFAETDNG